MANKEGKPGLGGNSTRARYSQDRGMRALLLEHRIKNHLYREEASAEVAPPPPIIGRSLDADEASTASGAAVRSAGKMLGAVALIFAIASLFIWPLLLGITAAVLGFVAYRQKAQALGGWAMGIGIFAAVSSLVLYPLYMMWS